MSARVCAGTGVVGLTCHPTTGMTFVGNAVTKAIRSSLRTGSFPMPGKNCLRNVSSGWLLSSRSSRPSWIRPKRSGLPKDQLDAFSAWLKDGRIDAKRDDALAMLHSIRETLADDPYLRKFLVILAEEHDNRALEIKGIANGSGIFEDIEESAA